MAGRVDKNEESGENPFGDESGEDIPPDDVGDGKMLCGVPVLWFDDLQRLHLKGTGCNRAWNTIKIRLRQFQREHDAIAGAVGAAGVSPEQVAADFARIDAEVTDPRVAYRRKIQAALRQIDPLFFVNSLAGAMTDPKNDWARKLYADAVGLTKEAASEAKEDPAPAVSFQYNVADQVTEPKAARKAKNGTA